MSDHHDDDPDPDHGHDHGHGHANDQGVKGMLRYLRWAPRMWRSDINDAVVDLVAPTPGERVVDVGAGLGAGAVRALRSGAAVVAVEPTPFMRRILTVRRLLQRDRDRLVVVDGAAERLPVDDHSVDAIWAVNTMHHWIDQKRGVEEIVRVLRPGGRVVLVDEDFQDPSHPEFERFGTDHDAHEHHGFTMVDADQMGALLSATGLVDVEASVRRLVDRPVIAITARAVA